MYTIPSLSLCSLLSHFHWNYSNVKTHLSMKWRKKYVEVYACDRLKPSFEYNINNRQQQATSNYHPRVEWVLYPPVECYFDALTVLHSFICYFFFTFHWSRILHPCHIDFFHVFWQQHEAQSTYIRAHSKDDEWEWRKKNMETKTKRKLSVYIHEWKKNRHVREIGSDLLYLLILVPSQYSHIPTCGIEFCPSFHHSPASECDCEKISNEISYFSISQQHQLLDVWTF